MVIVRLDVKLFALAHLGAKLKRSPRIFRSEFLFAQIVKGGSQRCVRHRQVRVQPDRTLEKRYRRCKVSLRDHGAASHRICLQSFERRRRGLLNRRCKLVYRLQGFAKPAAQLCCRFAERGQHMLFAVCSGLFLRKRIACLTIDRVDSQHILGS